MPSVEPSAVAGHQAEAMDRDVGDAVHPLRQVGVGPGLVRCAHHGPHAAAAVEPNIQRFADAVQLLRVGEARLGEPEIRPLRRRGQAVAASVST